MSKEIDPRLKADALQCLCAMGHGDTLVISDTNFPADRVTRETVPGELPRLQVVDAPDEIPDVQSEVRAQIDLARKSYAVSQTGKRRFYGCFLRKDAIGPDQ